VNAAVGLERGARVRPEGGVRFSVWAPNDTRVAVRLVSGHAEGVHPMERCARGVHELELEEAAAGDDYFLVLEDGRERPDPVSRHLPQGVDGPTRIVDPGRFEWSREGWRGRELARLVLYELHVGTFSRAGTFDGVREDLGRLTDLGIGAIELMPVSQFPGERNWGYDGASPYAVQSSYGGPEGLRRLVDAAHDAGIAVVLDVVYNHLGPEGSVLAEFGPYFTDRYKTPWGAALNLDGPESDEVRRFVLDNALYWLDEYRLDGLRLDAVHALFDFSAEHLLAEMQRRVEDLEAARGRRMFLIAESDLNDPRVVQPRERGGWGLAAQWSDDLHHAVHAVLTGERRGYYVDYGSARHVAKALERRFVLDGVWSEHRRRRHGAPAANVPAERFVVFIQNHDQVGNRARGERLAALVTPDALRLAAALLLLSPYVPLLFMGEELAETRPFLYFVSHGDPELIEAVRAGRRREFASFGHPDDVPDPADPSTFERSRIDRGRAGLPEGRAALDLYRDLIAWRRREPALTPGTARTEVRVDEGAGWIALGLLPAPGRGSELLALFQIGAEPAEIELDELGGEWEVAFSSEDVRYGGGDENPASRLVPASGPVRVLLAGHSAKLLRRAPPRTGTPLER